jgi:hypothetical protein
MSSIQGRFAEHLAVQEQQGRQRLALGGVETPPSFARWERKDSTSGPHVPGVPQAVEAHKGLHPQHIGPLGPQAVVQITQALAQLIQQARRRGAAGGACPGTASVLMKRLYEHTVIAPRPVSSPEWGILMLLTPVLRMLSCRKRKIFKPDKHLASNALECYPSRRDVMRHF